MTLAVLCGGAAGAAVAAGVVDLAGARAGVLPAGARGRPRGARAVEALVGLGRRVGAPAPRQDLAERIEAAGAPLSETLAAQAAEARADRARRIREQAAKAAPKIQLVVALLLVPSVMLLVVAALVAALVH